MKHLSIIAALMLAVAPCWAALPDGTEILEVHNIEHNGQTYKITELVEEKRERISKWNALRFKRGDKYRAYKVVDSTGVVRLSPVVYKAHKKELRKVLDRRPWSEQHPDLQRTIDNSNRWGTQINTLATWVITVVK